MPRTLALHLFSDDKASYDEYGKGYITEMYCDILLSKGLVKKQSDDVTDSGVKVDLVTADNVPLVLSSYEGQGQDITVSTDSSKKTLVLAYCNIDAVKYTILSLYGGKFNS